MNYTLSEIADFTGGTIRGKKNPGISQLLIDSRISPVPAGALFFALKGQLHDGHNYVADLYRRGIRAFVVSDMRQEFRELPEAGFVVVKDTLHGIAGTCHASQGKISLSGHCHFRKQRKNNCKGMAEFLPFR